MGNKDLMAKIQNYVDRGINPSFHDFDISQNPIPYDQFDQLFTALTTAGSRVERLRFFGCATLDDAVALLLAEWLRTTTVETCPQEMHISDCALTSDGFGMIVDAIEINDAFPTPDGFGRRNPVYMRVESNYIEDSVIQERINSGVIVEFLKASGPIRGPVATAPNAKIKLLVHARQNFSQKKGSPPAPQLAAPPKPVWDRNAEDEAKAKGNLSSQQQWPSWTQTPPPWRAWPAGSSWPAAQAAAPTMWQQPVQNFKQTAWPTWPTAASAATPGWMQSASPKATIQPTITPRWMQQAPQKASIQPTVQKATIQPAVLNPSGANTALNGTATTTKTDARSRSPPPKVASKQLPKPWEEHFSEEFGLPYYWNAETDESRWERPTQ